MPLEDLTDDEGRVCEEIARRETELVELVCNLIGFDTTTHVEGASPRDELALQEYLGARLRESGAVVKIWEPSPELVAGHRIIPAGFTFKGRPQLLARFAGVGHGRALLLHGHVDVVSAEPLSEWRRSPFVPAVEEGYIHGRGACDMKGGVAAMVFAAEVIAQCGIKLAGDLIVNTVTEEESTGAGGLVTARTVRADAAIVPEPSGLDIWVACRGSLLPTITVTGRAGHAGIPPQHPDDGGAVNAIEKMGIVLDTLRRLREEWALRYNHDYLSAPDCVPTMISGGEWLVSYPARCTLDCHIQYLPDQADEEGYGSFVEQEFEDWLARAATADPWLRRNPPRVEWLVGGVPPAEVSVADPIVKIAVAATECVGRPGQVAGFDNWHDGATLIVEAGIPAICLGPGDIRLAHTTEERVPIADVVACSQALAVAAMRNCGSASTLEKRLERRV